MINVTKMNGLLVASFTHRREAINCLPGMVRALQCGLMITPAPTGVMMADLPLGCSLESMSKDVKIISIVCRLR